MELREIRDQALNFVAEQFVSLYHDPAVSEDTRHAMLAFETYSPSISFRMAPLLKFVSEKRCATKQLTWIFESPFLYDYYNVTPSERVLLKDIVCRLLEKGADVNHKIRNSAGFPGYSFLSVAAEKGYSDIVQILLDAGADIEENDPTEGTALIHAVGSMNAETVCVLVAAGANVHAQRKDRYSILTYAIYSRSLEIVRILVDAGGADVNFIDEFGATALMVAACEGHAHIVRYLLDVGADVNAHVHKTTLMYAVRSKDVDVVRMVLDAGADVHAVDNNGRTALLYAALAEHIEIVRLLIEYGADIHSTGDNGRTALMYAAAGNNADLVRLLLEAGADVNVMDTYEGMTMTALMLAARDGHIENVRLLLDAGARVDIKNKHGLTAADCATRHKHPEIVELLKCNEFS